MVKINNWFQDYYHSLFEACSEFNLTPNSYKEIKSLPNRDKWSKAVDEELNSIKLNNVWKVVKNKENVKPLKSKWVFKIKEDANGNPLRFKARLLKGFL